VFVRYAVADLGANLQPDAISNTGYITLYMPNPDGHNFGYIYRWYAGVRETQPLTGAYFGGSISALGTVGAGDTTSPTFNGPPVPPAIWRVGTQAPTDLQMPSVTPPAAIGGLNDQYYIVDPNGNIYIHAQGNDGQPGTGYIGSVEWTAPNYQPSIIRNYEIYYANNNNTIGYNYSVSPPAYQLNNVTQTFHPNAVSSAGWATGNDYTSNKPVVFGSGTVTFVPNATYLGLITHQILQKLNTDGTIAQIECPQIIGYDTETITSLFQRDPTTGTYQAYHLSDLIGRPKPWQSLFTTGMNDNGVMIGQGTQTTDTLTHGALFCPIAVVSDPGNTYQVDMTNPPLSYVRFGLWDNAFSKITPPTGTATPATPTLNNDNAEASNFVGSDSRRFYFRICDPSAIGDPTKVQTVSVDWFTLNYDGTNDDHLATDTITLTETAAGSGIFASKALMLVTDDVDNGQATNTGLDGTYAGEGVANHRLRRAQLGDLMCCSYTPGEAGSTKQTFSWPIFNPSSVPGASDAIKNITVHFVEAYSTSPTFNNHGNMKNDVASMEAQIAVRFAAAGIKATFIYNPADVHAPTNDVIDVTATGVDLNHVDATTAATGSAQDSIARVLRSKYGNFNPADPTIYVIVVGQFNPIGTSIIGGDSITDGLVAAEPSYAMSQRCTFLAQVNGINYPVSTPHEIGHQLSCQIPADIGVNNNHYDGNNLGQNMMYYKSDDGTQITDAKRLWDDSQQHSYVAIPITNQIDFMRQSPLCH
jgi:hypothetical protein